MTNAPFKPMVNISAQKIWGKEKSPDLEYDQAKAVKLVQTINQTLFFVVFFICSFFTRLYLFIISTINNTLRVTATASFVKNLVGITN